jgi:hypothetical protein
VVSRTQAVIKTSQLDFEAIAGDEDAANN